MYMCDYIQYICALFFESGISFFFFADLFRLCYCNRIWYEKADKIDFLNFLLIPLSISRAHICFIESHMYTNTLFFLFLREVGLFDQRDEKNLFSHVHPSVSPSVCHVQTTFLGDHKSYRLQILNRLAVYVRQNAF